MPAPTTAPYAMLAPRSLSHMIPSANKSRTPPGIAPMMAPPARVAHATVRSIYVAGLPSKRGAMKLGMRWMVRVVVACIVLADTATAQSIGRPDSGKIVRIWSPELARRPYEGIVLGSDADSFALRRKGRRGAREAPARISRAGITRMDMLVPRTRKEGVRYGAIMGGVLGVGNGLMLGALTSYLGAEYYPNGTDRAPAPPLVFEVTVGVAAGIVLGAAMGWVWPGQRFHTVIRAPER